METEHEFTLILDGISEVTPSIADALFEAGCDDATISREGSVVSMDFDRAAPSMRDAVISAIADVHKAGMKVSRVDGAAPDPFFAVVNSTLQIWPLAKLDPTLSVVVAKILG